MNTIGFIILQRTKLMKYLIRVTLIVVILLMFNACKNTDNNTSPAPAQIYYDYLISLGEIETERSSTVGGGIERWNVYDLYYYLDDINDDGIIDLAISAEKSDSNGIEIYTYKNGQIEKLVSKRMPYSAGTEVFTLAKYEDTYGIKYLRFNSVGEFSFFRINKDGTIESMFEGWSYDLNGNALDGAVNYDKINPITFYSIEELEKMF